VEPCRDPLHLGEAQVVRRRSSDQRAGARSGVDRRLDLRLCERPQDANVRDPSAPVPTTTNSRGVMTSPVG
jgi:hypothetical protein